MKTYTHIAYEGPKLTPRKVTVVPLEVAEELLEALQGLLYETNAGTWDCLPVDRAKAAIAKAAENDEGEGAVVVTSAHLALAKEILEGDFTNAATLEFGIARIIATAML